jgi:hypothetical protein
MRTPAPLFAVCAAMAGGCTTSHVDPSTVQTAAEPCPETIEFSGLRWRVSSGRMQGDTRWSRCGVELDGGALRMTLSRAAGEPYRGAQIALAAGDDDAHLGFGRYEFLIDSVLRQALPPKGVFAMFSYGGPSGIDGRGVWGYNEIDVEINRSWLRAENGRAVGRPPVYTVWPTGPGGARPRKPVSGHLPAQTRPDPLALPSRHVFDWAPGTVRFSSWNADQESPFFSWAAGDEEFGAGAVPSTPMVPMLNLWTVAGGRPAGTSVDEQRCGRDYPCGTWTVVVRSVRLPIPIHKHAGDGQQGTPGTRLPDPLVVRVADERGRPMSGVSVEFTLTRGGGTLTASADRVTTTTDAEGLARAVWTLGDAGAQEVEACVVNGTRSPVRFDARLRPGLVPRVRAR